MSPVGARSARIHRGERKAVCELLYWIPCLCQGSPHPTLSSGQPSEWQSHTGSHVFSPPSCLLGSLHLTGESASGTTHNRCFRFGSRWEDHQRTSEHSRDRPLLLGLNSSFWPASPALPTSFQVPCHLRLWVKLSSFSRGLKPSPKWSAR